MAYQNYQLSVILSWQTDSTIKLQFRTINFQKEQLNNITIVNKMNSYQQLLLKIDSILIPRGTFSYTTTFSLKTIKINPYQDTLPLQIKVNNTLSKKEINNIYYKLPPIQTSWSTVTISDSIFLISHSKKQLITYQLHSSLLGDSLDNNHSFSLTNDSTFLWYELIKSAPLKRRKFQLTQINRDGQTKKTMIYYRKGRFYQKPPIEDLFNLNLPLNKKKNFDFNGSLNLEHNFFSETPQHSNGSQYPFSAIHSSTTISLYGIPLTIAGTYNTNENISPNFQNFFSLQFDANTYATNALNQLKQTKNYSVDDIKKDLKKNKKVIEELKTAQKILNKFPSTHFPVDSLLNKELKFADYSVAKDSLLLNDSLIGKLLKKEKSNSFDREVNQIRKQKLDSITAINADYESIKEGGLNHIKGKKIDSITAINTNYKSIKDSISLLHAKRLKRVQKSIEQLEQSTKVKENYLEKVKEKEVSLQAIKQISSDELFSQFNPRSLLSILLRFKKLEIGNFYEYTGVFSINDVEIKGVNTSLLINPKYKLGFLTGRINDFQSFALDDIEDNKKVSSLALTNTSLPYFSPTLRITQFKNETINPELTPIAPSYYLASINTNGGVNNWMRFEVEINQTINNINLLRSINEGNNKNRSFFVQTYLTPTPFLDVKLNYSKVGSLYQSDGVYFLNRNTRTFSGGIKLRLFNNLIHLKNDFALIERNVENRALSNQTQKQFFDIGTHFKRFPNIQVSYSPISVEVANQLDTSFSGIDANTNVLIAKLSYLKRIRETILSTNLIYNEIENELANDSSIQKGIQHFINISNKKINLSFVSAYVSNFNTIRFISSTYSHKISKKMNVKASLAKNFKDAFYSEIIRTEITFQFFKQFNLSLGSIFLIERNSNEANTGGTIGLKINY